MRFGSALLRSGERLLDRVVCVLGAAFFAQAPEFFQQYLQRLGGHLDEARRQLQQFENVAVQSGITLEELATQTQASSEITVSRLGGVIQATIERVDALTQAQAALIDATVWSRPFVFVRTMDVDIARATGHFFKPAVPTTVEGLIYAFVGMLVALGLFQGLVRFPLWKWRQLRAQRATPVPVP